MDISKIVVTAQKVRNQLIKEQGGAGYKLAGTCVKAADILKIELEKVGIKSSKHFGWVIYDSCDNCSGEPCAPHCYLLVHNGNEKYYLDITADQFDSVIADTRGKNIILLHNKQRPSWFRKEKPSIKEMEYLCGY